MTARRLHRLTAIGLTAFIALHLANHLLILGGAEVHLAGMNTLRKIYRFPPIEITIFVLFFMQASLGLFLLLKGGRPKTRPRWVQFISGIIFALFVVQHLSAVLLTRMTEPAIDTNAYWAASVVSRAPFSWYFVPYYALGVFSLFAHIGAALYQRPRQRPLSKWIIAAGAALTIAIVPGFMGLYGNAIKLPPAYEAYLDGFAR